MYIESMNPLIPALIGPFLVVLPTWASWGQIPGPVAEVSESEYRALSDYIADTFTGDKGEHRVAHRVSKIVIVNKTQSDRNDDHADLETNKPLSWKTISAYLHKNSPRSKLRRLTHFAKRTPTQHPSGTHFTCRSHMSSLIRERSIRSSIRVD